ncbi:translesion error-prone DNA polymerase V autoproteolytic subunit [Porticoccaceae bacterium LTM1]|nr:translesion error-prone DNA polymerase V autoproteolytic subunit [Porticoccaceae bacterium LTM1]
MKATIEARPLAGTVFYAPLYGSHVQAGFPSPADDYIEQRLDLNEHLIKHPAATFYARAAGDSMTDFGIFNGDLLIVDRALHPKHGDIVIAALDGELTCKILNTRHHQLCSGNQQHPPIPISSDSSLIIEGVVVASIRQHRC